MINAYKFSNTWRYLLIIPSIILFLLFWLLYIFGGGSLDMPIAAWTPLIVVSAISGWVIYGTMISKLTTSPNSIESVTLGIRVEATWDKVEKIDMTPDGFINLVFKEPIYTSKLANVLFGLLAYDKIIQISPFIDDPATSDLLKDIAKYVPNSNIPKFVAQQKHSTQTYQKAGMIGLYYFGCFIAWALFALFSQKRFEEYLAALGLSNADPILTFVGLSLVIGLFVNTMSLLKGYNAEVVKLDEYEISHRARTYYLSPAVTIAISFFVGMGIWAFKQTHPDVDFEVPIMFLMGTVSLWISSKIERLLFGDDG